MKEMYRMITSAGRIMPEKKIKIPEIQAEREKYVISNM
jgi:hypothetical protein